MAQAFIDIHVGQEDGEIPPTRWNGAGVDVWHVTMGTYIAKETELTALISTESSAIEGLNFSSTWSARQQLHIESHHI